MTGPELDHELEALGRRLSPRVGAAHDAVVARAIGGEAGRRPRTALPRPGRLGGAVLTLAFTAGFAALLAVGVANRPAGPNPATSANGPAVAMATGPASPEESGSPAGVPPTRDTSPPPATPRVAVPPAAPVATAPGVSSGGTGTGRPAPRTQTPPPAVVATEPPASTPPPPPPPDEAAATDSPWPQPSPTPSSRSTQGPASGRTIVLTEKDSGRTITVHRGDVVEVDLSAPQQQPSWRWTEPQSTDETVAHRTSGAARNDGSAYAVFGAAGDGNARVYASRMPECYFSTPRCYPPVAIDFQVTIVVTG